MQVRAPRTQLLNGRMTGLNLGSAGIKIVDGNGQTLAYVYGHVDQRDAAIAKALTLNEARRIASNIAKLPDLLKHN